MLFSVLASRKGGLMRDNLGEESGLFPVGLQGEPERQDDSDQEHVAQPRMFGGRTHLCFL